MNWKLLLLVGLAVVGLFLLLQDDDVSPVSLPARKIAVEGAVTLPVDLDVSEELLRAVQVEEARVLSHGAATLSVLPLAGVEGVETAVVRPRILVEGASVAGPVSAEDGSGVPSVVAPRILVEHAAAVAILTSIEESTTLLQDAGRVAIKLIIENAGTVNIYALDPIPSE